MGIIKAEVELRKNASILPFMEMRRDSEGYNTSKRADTHPNNPETWASGTLQVNHKKSRKFRLWRELEAEACMS